MIKKVEKLTNYKYINMFRATYDNKGKDSIWDFVSRKKNPEKFEHKADAVCIVPILVNKNSFFTFSIIMIKEFRPPLGDYEYAFPAGLIDEGETVEEAARRELREETGLEIENIEDITPPLYSSGGLTDESVSIVFATCTGTPTTINSEKSENIEIINITRDELADPDFLKDKKIGIRDYLSLAILDF